MSLLDRVEDKLDRVTRYESYISALCPFHDDTSPSFLVYEDFYICKSCGAKGHPQELLKSLGNTFRPKPVSYNRSNPFTGWLHEMSLETLCQRSHKLLKKLPHMGKYLHDRGIDHDTILRTKIGYRDEWFIVPVLDRDEKVIGAVARAGSKKAVGRYFVPTGQEMLLYCPSWKLVEEQRAIFLVYGILDSVSLESIGRASVTGTLGKKIDPTLLKDIRKRIYIIPDNGEEREAQVLASQLDWRGKYVSVDYPQNTKDVNDLLTKKPDKLREIINGLEFCKRDSSWIGNRKEAIS